MGHGESLASPVHGIGGENPIVEGTLRRLRRRTLYIRRGLSMCGLLALLTADANAAKFVDPVGHALPCMYHRGPDAAGTWNDEDAVFGFNRLAIIDLEHSHQPLQWDPEGEEGKKGKAARYSLTFNGEIYNYVELRAQLLEDGVDVRFAAPGRVLVDDLLDQRRAGRAHARDIGLHQRHVDPQPGVVGRAQVDPGDQRRHLVEVHFLQRHALLAFREGIARIVARIARDA